MLIYTLQKGSGYMALRLRYIPPDINEDIKFGKVVPTKAIPWIVGIAIAAVLISFLIPSPLIRIPFFLGVTCVGTGIFIFDLPLYVQKLKRYLKERKKINSLDAFSGIAEYGSVSKTKDKGEEMFLEYFAEPWEVCPDAQKELRAREFAENVLSAINMGVEISIFAVSTSENTGALERRLEQLGDLPPGLRELEYERIEYHYHLSRQASSTHYYLRFRKEDTAGMRISEEDDEQVEHVQDAITFEGTILGGDTIREVQGIHLTPDVKLSRGRRERRKDHEKKTVRKGNRKDSGKKGKSQNTGDQK